MFARYWLFHRRVENPWRDNLNLANFEISDRLICIFKSHVIWARCKAILFLDFFGVVRLVSLLYVLLRRFDDIVHEWSLLISLVRIEVLSQFSLVSAILCNLLSVANCFNTCFSWWSILRADRWNYLIAWNVCVPGTAFLLCLCFHFFFLLYRLIWHKLLFIFFLLLLSLSCDVIFCWLTQFKSCLRNFGRPWLSRWFRFGSIVILYLRRN